VIDRLVYGNYEPLIALAAAAAVTERVKLVTAIMIAPYRLNAALVAKQAATIDGLSGGRLTVGAAVGGREDDFEASGADFHRRGAVFDEMLKRWAAADAYLLDCYAFLGAYAPMVASSAAIGPEEVRGVVRGFAAAGCDELILFPCRTDPEEVARLADAVL
jgi:hypothetical protein